MTRSRTSDLTPPLGWYGGPCLVVDRIRQEVRTPALRDTLEDQVEAGKPLSNPDAAKVYDLEVEKGVGIFKQVRITAHAQYRMDLRGVTVGDIRIALNDFLKKLGDWKSQQAWEYRHYTELLTRGEPVEWVDKRLGDLVVIFATARQGGGVVDIVTTYWKGLNDPKPETCPVRTAYSPPAAEMSGFRTWVKDPTPSKSDTGEGKYKERALPSPPWKREKPSGGTVYNTPGESGSSGDGRSIHKDKARTQSKPGEDSPHPASPARTTPTRRPEVTADAVEAGMTGPPFPGTNRQKVQRGESYKYDKKKYRQNRSRVVREQQMRYKRLRRNPRFKLDRERRKEFPQKFQRRPGGGATDLAGRSRDQRERSKKASLEPIPFFFPRTEEWGWVVEVTSDGWVTYVTEEITATVILDEFLGAVTFDEEDLSRFVAYLDQVFDYEDPVEKLARRVVGDFFYEKRPPEMDPEQKFDRAHSQPLPEKLPAEDLGEYDDEIHDSNPGSRVYPSGKGHVEKEAALIHDIRQGCGPELLDRASQIRPKLSRVDAKNGMWHFEVQGSDGPHRVRLKALRQGNTRDLKKVHVLVSCSCPFWRWQGPEYWAKEGGYLYGKPRGLATKPDVKDPHGQHRACKHALAVFDHVLGREWMLAPLSKQGALRFLVDSLREGEVMVVHPEFERSVSRVAARYLAGRRSEDA